MALAYATLASFSHANNIIKAILSARDRVINLEQITSLQSEIASINNGYLALQQQASALLEEKDNLKKEIARIEAWDSQKDRYQLYAPWSGSITYALKESESCGEPPHWICTHCYGDRKRGFLQYKPSAAGPIYYACDRCGAKITGDRSINHPVTFEYIKERNG